MSKSKFIFCPFWFPGNRVPRQRAVMCLSKRGGFTRKLLLFLPFMRKLGMEERVSDWYIVQQTWKEGFGSACLDALVRLSRLRQPHCVCRVCVSLLTSSKAKRLP